MKQYGFMDSPSNYKFDHLIPLELASAPDDMKTSGLSLIQVHLSRMLLRTIFMKQFVLGT